MSSVLVYKGIVAILLVGVVGASGIATYFYQQQNTKISQASDLNNQVGQLQGQTSTLNNEIASLNKQIDSLNSQLSQQQAVNSQLSGSNSQYQGQISTLDNEVASLDKQIDSLNSQISQLQTLNNQLGGSNSELVSQVQTLQSQLSQLQSQVNQLGSQLSNLNRTINLQNSRVIASQVCIYSDCPGGNGGNPIGGQLFVSLGSISYSGYIRVSWTSGGVHASFSMQVFDVNITTPIATSGIFSLPVGANATGNAWFTNYDCVPIPAGTYCPPMTYSATYWY